MGAKERRKGHDYERSVARRLRETFPNAKRGFQTRGGSGEESDVKNVGPFKIECKHHKSQPSVVGALRQAAKAPGENLIPVAFTKKTYGDEIVSMYAEDFFKLLEEFYG